MDKVVHPMAFMQAFLTAKGFETVAVFSDGSTWPLHATGPAEPDGAGGASIEVTTGNWYGDAINAYLERIEIRADGDPIAVQVMDRPVAMRAGDSYTTRIKLSEK